MKALMAAIALLCLSSTVLAHDIYSNLRDKDGHLCCGGEDRKPGEVVGLPDGSYYLQGLMKLFPPTWQHHRLMIVSTFVSIIQCFQLSLIGMDQYGRANARLDASLLQSTLRSHCPYSNFPNNLFASSCGSRRQPSPLALSTTVASTSKFLAQITSIVT